MEGKLEAPKRLAWTVQDLHLGPKDEEFRSRTVAKTARCQQEFGPQPGFKILRDDPIN